MMLIKVQIRVFFLRREMMFLFFSLFFLVHSVSASLFLWLSPFVICFMRSLSYTDLTIAIINIPPFLVILDIMSCAQAELERASE
jgi:hypothetical protein